MEHLRQLIHEIHRRNLWQVLGVYVAGSVAVLGGAGTLQDALRLPEWFVPLAFGLLIVGVPIVLATAFVQEGATKSEADSSGQAVGSPRPARRLFTWRNAIAGGVLAFALWGVVAAGWVMLGTESGLVEPSVAVMPCEDLSPSADQQALAHGVSEEVSIALSQLPDLKVSGRASVLAMQAQAADLRTIASTLGVANVFQCSLLRDQGQVRVNAQLTEASSGTVIWSERIDRQYIDLFDLLNEIAQGVTEGLEVVFAGGDDERIVALGTTNPAAHEAYLRGRFLWSQRTQESLQNAITEFERAIELDSTYAAAHSGLADAYTLLNVYAGTVDDLDSRQNYDRALNAAGAALAFNPNLAMARASRGSRSGSSELGRTQKRSLFRLSS